jgi:sugar lactone lactonase YvrE
MKPQDPKRTGRLLTSRSSRRHLLRGVAVGGAMTSGALAQEATSNKKEGSMPEPLVLLTDLALGESPRWYEDRLWFSDIGAQEVGVVDLAGTHEIVARVPTVPSGLGFLPDGHLLIVSVGDGRLLRRETDGSLATYADLNALSDQPWNDLVVDGRGNAYVSNMGFDFPVGAAFSPGLIALVTPDGAARQVADGLAFANGLIVTPDNATLIVAESYANRLTAFDIAADGGLSNQRAWADLGEGVPDGICLDAEGAVWYGDPGANRCVRVREGGAVLQTIELDRGCFACMLGDADRRTLFLMANDLPDLASPASDAGRTGQILTVAAPAPVPGGRRRR